jgi:precorrin-6A/cobalt-precorrin-6A reductase
LARLWLIGGTAESRHIIAALQAQASLPPTVVTVTTESARQLYPPHPALTVWVGTLAPSQGRDFIAAHDIGAILDASHPFAADISRLAIALAQAHSLPYLRYERPVASAPEPPWRDRRDRPGLVALPTWADLLQSQYLGAEERTLFTTGTRQLQTLQPWQSQSTLFVRVLPQPDAIAAALAAGFLPQRIIALRPPISPALEQALWQQWQITQVVTKASGATGGEDHKRAIAAQLGVRLFVLTRPRLPYPRQTQVLAAALAFVSHWAQDDASGWMP